MNIVCIGGGPAGLYFGLLMKKQNPAHQITVVERNRPYDTFGWGVVFSDQTLGNLANADEQTARAILESFNHWDDIDVFFKGEKVSSGGHGFCGIGRKHLLNILQHRCEELGVQLVFETDVADDQEIAARYQADLVIASDGLNSRIRTRYASTYQPQIEARQCRFVWLGTRKKFDAFTFAFKETEHGWFQAHIYQYDAETSTFIVETPESVWRAAGLDQMSQEEGIAFCEKLFAEQLDGHALMSNATHLRGSAIWITFPRIVCGQWVHWHGDVPVVLMGDAAHSAHYSIGSGTKLALEDAIELARCFAAHGEVRTALAAYQELRAVEVLKIQSAARNSMEWFENVSRYTAMEAPQFAYSMLTRSQRLSHENLRLRDARYVADFERWFAERAQAQAGLPAPASVRGTTPPMFTSLPGARPDIEEPHSGLADGAVQRGRRRRGRLSSGPPGRARDGRRGHGDGGDDLRIGRCAHHTLLPGYVHAGAYPGLEAGGRLCAPAHGRQDRPAAGPCGRQGFDARHVGWHRPAAGSG